MIHPENILYCQNDDTTVGVHCMMMIEVCTAMMSKHSHIHTHTHTHTHTQKTGPYIEDEEEKTMIVID